MSTLLQVMDVTKVYKNQPKPGLDHVSFEVEKGEFLGIMGASGSGKTTLLNVLSTIDIPTSGHIIMGKTHIEKLGQGQAADFRKNNLGFIFQEYFLLDSLTVRENIAVPLTLLHKPAKEIDKKVKELAASCTTDADIAAAVYDYMVKNIQYDTEKAATVQNGYLPSPDETLKTGKGICFDYASLAAAMLRSEGIPCKLITGYVGEETYHAWNSFYVESEGWITVEIRAKADEWQRVDITFAAGGMPAGEIQNDSEYTTRFTY